jgi:hypothetical protein
MVCSKQNLPNININIYLKKNRIEQVNSFKYLCNIIINDGKLKKKKEIKSRKGQAKKAFLLKSKLLTTTNVDLRTRKRLIKTYVWSTALYGSETWTLNKKDDYRSFINVALAKNEENKMDGKEDKRRSI